ncbi:aminoacyl-tRNA hydrolase [Candidatus Kuenenbacteria bacterium CG1_02_38_13]|nr:MAG: aminoacyl-tRNA hydrolase [Candidatus Kuenenbacteria bacterium CG1_02_38_13]
MKLIVGLGNPGKKYGKTRHNVGFMAVDFLAKKFDFADFKIDNKYSTALSSDKINDEKIIFAKPQTYMNNSGDAVLALQSFYKINPQDTIIIYDELDLPLGKIRVRNGGSSAGHRGIESIIKNLGTDQFKRIRIGIDNSVPDQLPADKFVLARFKPVEIRQLQKNIFNQVANEVEKIIAENPS